MSKRTDTPAPAQANSVPGAHARAEILSQPHCWSSCLKQLENKATTDEIGKAFSGVREWLFVGCGSSYYLALAAAASWTVITGVRARAVPASELLLAPDLVLNGLEDVAAIVISRSGRTSEVLRAAEYLEDKNIRTLAISCAADQPLEQIASSTIALSPADEESTVMTRSFTSMLLGLQYLAACMSDEHALSKALRHLPTAVQPVLGDLHPRIQEFVAAHRFADYVCLGQGPFYGLACESALKLTEMSVSYGQSFHTLEFRHGPKSIVASDTLIMFLISQRGYDAECGVLEEIKALGGTTLVITNFANERVQRVSDFLVELKLDVPEIARLAPYVFAAQLLGLYTGIRKGLDPDNPRHLTRVVMLDEDEPTERPEHASF